MTDIVTAEVEYDPFSGFELDKVVPTTAAQREIWLADRQSAEASLSYNESVTLSLSGNLQVQLLKKALEAVVNRHEALRATFSGDGLSMLIRQEAPQFIRTIDMTDRSAQEQAEGLEALKVSAVDTPFDLMEGPLIRAEIVKLSPNEHRIVLTCHHIVCDGWSFGVIASEIGKLYQSAIGEVTAALPTASGFGDYAINQSGRDYQEQAEADAQWWATQFAGEVPVLELPTDSPRGPERSFRSRREDLKIDRELLDEVRRVGSKNGASLFVTLCTTFAGLISRLSGKSDVVVGVPAAGQTADNCGQIVGHCVQLLPIRFSIEMGQQFRDALKSCRTPILNAYEHQSCTFGTILQRLRVERSAGRLPLVSVVFNLDSAILPESLSTRTIRIDLESNARRFENFDIFVNASQRHDGLILECQFNADLFSAESIRRWLELFASALERAVESPAIALGDAFAPSSDDLIKLAEFNATAMPYDGAQRIEDLISRQVRETPKQIAIVAGGRSFTYEELDKRSISVAARLVREGVTPGDLVGLNCGRSEAMIIGLYGILRAGAGYVPLDPSFPAERLAYMCADSRLAVIVSDHGVENPVTAASARRICVEECEPADVSPHRSGSPSDIAYVIYTSGSTGKPKGVRVPHRGVVNLLCSVAREPGLKSSDIVLAVTTLSFDIAVSEVILPLTVGARIVIAGKQDVMDGDRLRSLVEKERVTFIDATPSTWRLLLAAGWKGGRHVKAICTGEPLPPDLGRALLQCVGELWNGYGPTETTVWSTFHRVDACEGVIPIGRPVANTEIHIVDERQCHVPIGVVGHLFISGDGVTLGYLGRTDLTEEKFLPYPGRPGERWYKTGDLGRWRADGILECLGRSDYQVKVRGYRIELGEIEASLVSLPAIDSAVVTLEGDGTSEPRLIAYVVMLTGIELNEQQIRTDLRKSLPDYMIPARVVQLTALPLLPNGKIDRNALRHLRDREAATISNPRVPASALEALLLSEFEKSLNLPGIGVGDNFFSLGGHSLLAMQLAVRLSERLRAAVSMRMVFEHPTAKSLASALTANGLDQAESSSGARYRMITIPRRENQLRAPVSLMQQRMWFLENLNPGRMTYNTPSAHRLSGILSVPALKLAFNQMVARQTSLRTYFQEVDGEPEQVVAPDLHIDIQVDDLSDLEVDERNQTLHKRLRELTDQIIELTASPLFRVHLIKVSEEEHVLFFMPHHIIWDGWSFDLFYEEMAELYASVSAGTPASVPDLTVTYGDFSEWHTQWLQGDELSRQVKFWRERLNPLPEPLELPTDQPRPANMSGSGSTEWISLDKAVVDQARALASRYESTLFMFLFACYVLELHKLTGQDEFVVGTPVRGRNVPGVEKVMGFFVNALPVKISLTPDISFVELLRRTRKELLDAFSHQDVPFEHLVRELDVPRDESRSPIYQAFFSFQDARQRVREWGTVKQENLPLLQRGAAEDMGLWFLEQSDGLVGGISYNTDILNSATVQSIGRRFRHLVETVTADPSLALRNVPALMTSEAPLLGQWNSNSVHTPVAVGLETLASLIDRTVATRPDNIAADCDGSQITYAQLGQRANHLAVTLRERGVGRGSLIGLCVERGLEMLVAQLAVLKAGAAYVPLDPTYPAERLAFMTEDSELALLLTQSQLSRVFPWPAEKTLVLNHQVNGAGDSSEWKLPPDSERDARPEDPAYVIYTSGSTGRPKGVVVPHRAVTNFLASMAREPGLAAEDRLLAVTTLSFDIAVLELLLPLSVGARVVIATRDQATDGGMLRDLMARSGATVMQATPATWRMLIDSGWSGGKSFKALVGGEALAPDLADQLLSRARDVWNMYGPTETTVWSTCWRVTDPNVGIFIGRPIANTQVYVLDKQGQLCPPGVYGEIWIGGAGVSSGYLKQPALTASRFVNDAVNGRGTIYGTGDRGRWRDNGLIEHGGRLDFQVKVRGHRIELGEIEAALGSHPAVSRVVVIVREDRLGDVRLVAYVVLRGSMPTTSEFRDHLKRKLPDYMIPQQFVEIESVPTLPNGKIDRKSLPAPDSGSEGTSPEIESNSDHAFTPMEAMLASIWREVLGVQAISHRDTFFDLGGHSLLVMQVVTRMEKLTGKRIGIRHFVFENLEQIARAYEDAKPHNGEEASQGKSAIRRLFSVFKKT